ncbi:MAG: 3-deoxy-D-manno-octulosonic acid transferase [Bacteroidota bacterium]
MKFIYTLLVFLYGCSIRVAALFSSKARDWVQGRDNWRSTLTKDFGDLPEQRIWMHCASLGEFEQGRPVLEALRIKYPKAGIVLSFFSPSGFKHHNAAGLADQVVYLPLDGPRSSRDFIEMLNPAAAIFVKYEFWYFYSLELQRREIPFFCISAIFRDGQVFFRWYGRLFRSILKRFDLIFVQNDDSRQRLAEIGVGQVVVSGDTRFDRVLQLPSLAADFPAMRSFCSASRVLVAGSTWPPDEELLWDWIKNFPDWKLVIAPHQLSAGRAEKLAMRFGPDAICYSSAKAGGDYAQYRVMIIDSVGMLSRLYRFSTVSYIGGGFGVGIHNTLEAAVYGHPVIFGPNYTRFREACGLIDCGAALSVSSVTEMISCFRGWEEDPARFELASAAAKGYVHSLAGATERIVDGILKRMHLH